MNLSQRRVVVTGGAGFIGSHVIDMLVELGADVLVVDNLSVGRRENLARAEAEGARLVVGDVGDRKLLAREFAGADVVIHMAADNLRASLANPERSHDVNGTGSLLAALAAVEASAERFVYVSSSEAYGSALRIPMAEDHPLLPTTVYGAAKASGELYALACLRAYGLPAIVVRPFNSYGPRSHAVGTSAEVVPRFTARILAGLPPVIFGDGSQTRDFTWVEDTARGIVEATACDELVGDAVNIAHGEGVSIREVCDLLLELLEAGSVEPEFSEPRPGDVQHHYADTSKARSILGFECAVDIRSGLERYVEWARTERELGELGRSQPVRNW